jgi:hypothetical protein
MARSCDAVRKKLVRILADGDVLFRGGARLRRPVIAGARFSVRS